MIKLLQLTIRKMRLRSRYFMQRKPLDWGI